MQSQKLITDWEFHRGTLGGLWEVWRDKITGSHPDIAWEPVQIPHCFTEPTSVDPDNAYYQGHGWYRAVIDTAHENENSRILLDFWGAAQKSSAFIYDHEVARHEGGYDEFTVDITDAIHRWKHKEKFGTFVPVAVLCDNSRDLDLNPSDLADFIIAGGLNRPVAIRFEPDISIERVHLHTENVSHDFARVTLTCRLFNPKSITTTCRIEIEIVDPNGDLLYESTQEIASWADTKEIFTTEIAAPKLWSPDTPLLYAAHIRLHTETGCSSCSERFGLRYFAFCADKGFFLNGERLAIRGTHRHEDHSGVGAAMEKPLIERELRMIKEMGANFIRLGHYQQSHYVLELCDELGFLIWEEIPWCRGGLGGKRYRKTTLNMLRSMIDQHYNHPSIIIWGLGNENNWFGDFEECTLQDVRTFMTELNDLCHSTDLSRKTAIRRYEECRDIPDIYSPSIWAGWYRGTYLQYRQSLEEHHARSKLFFHAEWGAESHFGRHAEQPFTGIGSINSRGRTDESDTDCLMSGGDERISRDGDWSETYQCELLDWHLKTQLETPWLIGTAQWSFKDFATPLRPRSPIPYVNQKGVAARDLTPKDSYYIIQSYWSNAPMVRICGHTWRTRWGNKGEKRLVRIYSNCQTVELILNGISCGVKTRNLNDFPCCGLRWEPVFLEGTNRLDAIGIAQETKLTDSVEFTYQIGAGGQPERVELRAQPIGNEKTLITAELRDSSGLLCCTANQRIRFGHTGDGRLLDNTGTVGGSRCVGTANGRASILLELGSGNAVVSAQTDGCATTFVTVTPVRWR